MQSHRLAWVAALLIVFQAGFGLGLFAAWSSPDDLKQACMRSLFEDSNKPKLMWQQ